MRLLAHGATGAGRRGAPLAVTSAVAAGLVERLAAYGYQEGIVLPIGADGDVSGRDRRR